MKIWKSINYFIRIMWKIINKTSAVSLRCILSFLRIALSFDTKNNYDTCMRLSSWRLMKTMCYDYKNYASWGLSSLKLSSWKTIILQFRVLNHFSISCIHLKLLSRMYLKEMFLLSCRSWEVLRFKFERSFKNQIDIL